MEVKNAQSAQFQAEKKKHNRSLKVKGFWLADWLTDWLSDDPIWQNLVLLVVVEKEEKKLVAAAGI